jgi:import inner membrane translocase subunit TIM9
MENNSDKQTFREFFKTYNKMSEVCFNQCVWDFGISSMRGREERCVMNCVSKYLEANKEIGRVFATDQASVITTGSVSV